MKFVEASTDRAHLDETLMTGLHSGLLDAVEGAGMVTEENGGILLSEENPYSGFIQSFKNFAHTVGFTFKEDTKPSREYTNDEISAFLDELNEKFGTSNTHEDVILTPDDEKALEALSVCGFEKIHACSYLNFGFGRLPRESFPKLNMYRETNFVHHRLYENKQYIWMVYVTSDSYAEEVRKIFESLYFEEMEIPAIDVHKLLDEYEDRLNDIYAWCVQRSAVIQSYRYVAQFDDRYILSGFVQADNMTEYEAAFNDLPVTFKAEDPEEVPQFKCPTLLKNGWFARPFELFVEMYSLPAYSDFDPTMFFAITYCILFGIMFSDMGQGLVLILLGILFEKKGKLWGIIGRCGIFSTIFGFLFGSFFGYEDLLTPIHEKLFHTNGKLFNVMANSNTMTLLGMALAIGALLIIFSQVLNIWNNARHRKWDEVLFSQNGIAGLVFYVYLILALGASMIYKVNLFTKPLIWLCIVVPVVCFLMKEPFGRLVLHKKPVKPAEGWGGYLTQSFFEVFEILLSFITNSMSYLRVGGFVLSHAGMMLVVMTLMNMVSHGGIVVLILGNAFVMLLEGLVVGIQSLRLEYYEMFSRYYNGGGVKYKASAVTAE